MLTQRHWPSQQERQDARAARAVQMLEEVRQAPKPSVSYGGACSGQVVAKAPRAENRHLLNLARMQPCLLLSPVCQPDPATTVACHGAGVANGKGMGYKVGDHLTVWGCYACNDFTDAYNGATAQEKAAVFAAGHARQVEEWDRLAADPLTKPWRREAARWALEQLETTK